MESRTSERADVLGLLSGFPVVAIVGPRQVGKTTLAVELAKRWKGPTTHFDLERSSHVARLDDAESALEPLRGLIVIDEVQRREDLFPTLRVLADRKTRPASFLILGSASPTLLRQSSESLAGRIAYRELDGFGLRDIQKTHWRRLWLRGGFPRSFLARGDAASFQWRGQLIRTYLERDLPQLGVSLGAATLERFWTMLAHYHGQTWNSSELARSFGVADTTVRRWLDILVDTFMVRLLRPWSENLGKRVVKAPKLYIRDSGLLHSLNRIENASALDVHPRLGASFEGFALAETVRQLRVEWRDCWFWATHQGTELDLLVVRGSKRYGFEFKHTLAPEVTKSMKIALADLRLESLEVIHVGKETYPLTKQIRAVAFERLLRDVKPLQ